MRFDNSTNFSWNLALDSGSTYSDTLDFDSITAELSAPNEPWSKVKRLGRAKILIQVTEDFELTFGSFSVSAGAASDTAFLVDYLYLFSVAPVPFAELIAGYKFPILALPEFSQRYIRLFYNVPTGSYIAGKITAGLVLDRQTNK